MTSDERKERRYQRRCKRRAEAREAKSRQYGNFEEVFSFRHLYLSGKKCCKGVLWKKSTQNYIGNLIPNTAKTRTELMAGRFKRKGFHCFSIMERGKVRHIRSVHITERVVQKCLCDYCIVPTFSAAFIYDNSASLKRKGMDFTMRRMTCHLQRYYRRHGSGGYMATYDFHSFFDTAPHRPLFLEAERRLHDPRTREMANAFIKDFGASGLGLGSQISQTDALMLPNPIDHRCKEALRIRGYGRYMDDGYLIHHDRTYLQACLAEIRRACAAIGLTLNEKKTRIVPLRAGVRFLKTKFTLTDTGSVVIRMNRASTTHIRHKLVKFRLKLGAGGMTIQDVQAAYNSYLGHMKRGNSYGVVKSTNRYFRELFDFYPDKAGWEKAIADRSESNGHHQNYI